MARRLPLLAVGLSVLLWSSAYSLSGLVLATTSPAVLSVLRFALGLVLLVPLAARRPGFARALRAPRTLLLALTGVTLYYSLANIGLLFTTPGTQALTAALLPVFTALGAVLLLRERMPVRTIVGLAVATAGVGLVAASGLRLDPGLLLSVLALVAYAVYTVLLRRWHGDDSPDPLVLGTATAVWGTVLMLPWLAVEAATGGSRLPTGVVGIGGMLVLALVVTAPTMVLFNYGAERLPAAITGVWMAGIPALGYLISLLFGERFDAIKAIGGAVALVGVLIATLETPRVEPGPPGDPVAGV